MFTARICQIAVKNCTYRVYSRLGASGLFTGVSLEETQRVLLRRRRSSARTRWNQGKSWQKTVLSQFLNSGRLLINTIMIWWRVRLVGYSAALYRAIVWGLKHVLQLIEDNKWSLKKEQPAAMSSFPSQPLVQLRSTLRQPRSRPTWCMINPRRAPGRPNQRCWEPNVPEKMSEENMAEGEAAAAAAAEASVHAQIITLWWDLLNIWNFVKRLSSDCLLQSEFSLC